MVRSQATVSILPVLFGAGNHIALLVWTGYLTMGEKKREGKRNMVSDRFLLEAELTVNISRVMIG